MTGAELEEPMRAHVFAMLLCALALPVVSADTNLAPSSAEAVAAILPDAEAFYTDLHRHPELSFHEQRTAATLAEALRKLGFQVTTGVGKLGVVGVLKNGTGPTVMLRTEMDALPVKEQTGLAYASQVTTHNDAGVEVPVAHACGHDLHMASWMATATLLSKARDRWRGTLVLIGQPAEETVGGAAAMLKDGLFTRFPRPDYVIAMHDDSDLPAGTVGFTPGYSHANVDSVDITTYGKGGHGATPQNTVDPIVIAARTVLSLQTIVAREIDPGEPAVVTVGSIHGGTKHNIIPDQVHLQLTVRSYKAEVRKHLLAAIERIAKAESEAGGAPRPPLIEVSDSTDSVYNDPALTQRVAGVLRRRLGDDKVVQMPARMVAEDFSQYVEAGVPSMMFFAGAVNPAKLREAKAAGIRLPGLHSPQWAPDLKPALQTAIESETAVLLDLLGKP
jgi:amidohydrolase